MFELKVLSTGSKQGNNYKFRDLMIDIGVPYSRLVNKSKGINHLKDVKIIFVSHDHSDHMYFTSNKGIRNYSTAEKIKENYPNIMWVGGENFREIFEELELKHTIMEMNKVYNFGIIKLQLVKLYHDIENYGIRFFTNDNKKGIYITDTSHIEGINFKDYDFILIEANHIVEIHERLKETATFAPRYQWAMNSHLSFEQAYEAIKENAKDGSEIRLIHLSSDEEYKKLDLILHYIYRKEKGNERLNKTIVAK